MPVPLPKGDNEGIAFFPFEMSFSDSRSTAPTKNMIECRAGMPMHTRDLAGVEKLSLAGHGRKGEATRFRIDVTDQISIIRVGLAVFDVL